MIATANRHANEVSTIERSSSVIARLHGVSKRYGSVTALNNVNFDIRAGELVALLGPNGAGKTTAVKLFLGLAKADQGRVDVFGGNPLLSKVRARTGVMLQVGNIPETLRVSEHIELFSSYYPDPLPVAQTYAIAALESFKNRLFGELSGGQKQRVLFALALCGNPDLIFLDEPTVGLDVEARRLLWSEIRKLIERGKTVLLTTHYLEEADALADRVVVINKGQVITEGTPEQVKALTASRRIRCMTSLNAGLLQSISGVLEVRRDRDFVEISTADAEGVLRELFMLDSQLAGLEVTNAGLEEAFLALTTETNQAN